MFEKTGNIFLMIALGLLIMLSLQWALPYALHAEVQHKPLAPQGNFVPKHPDFKPVAEALKTFNFRKAIQETDHLNRHHKTPETREAAAFLMGDLYLVMAERGRPLLFRKALDAYREAHFRYPESKRTPSTLMKIGMIFLKESLYYEALATFDRIIKKYPKSLYVVPAQINRGGVYLQWGKYDKAILAFDKINPAILSQQESRFLLLNYAETYYLMNEYKTAFEYYELVSPQNPILQDSKKALYQYGISAYKSEAYTDARELLFILHNKYPKSTYSLLALARIGDSLRIQGKVIRAKKAYMQVHVAKGNKHHHKSASLIAAIGEFHLAGCEPISPKSLKPICFKERALNTEAGRLAYKTIQKSSKVLLQSVKNRRAFIDRLILEAASALELHQMFSESLKIKKALLKHKIEKPLKNTIQKSLPQTAISAVNQLLEEGQNIEALNIYYSDQKYFSPEILLGRTGLNLGIAFSESELHQEAVALLAPIARRLDKKKHGRHEKALFYLVKTRYKQKDYAAAERQGQAFIKGYPKSLKISKLQYLSAKASFAQGKTKLAIKKFEGWLSRYAQTPERAFVFLGLGDAYRKKGDLEQALESYLKIDEARRKTIPSLYSKIADTFFKLKNYKRSIAFYSKTIEANQKEGEVNWARFQLAQSYEKLGMKDKGYPIYSRLENGSQGLIRALSKQKAVELAPKTEISATP